MGVEGKATDLVLDLCRKTGGDTYLSGIHGKDYLKPEAFQEAGVRLEFQEYEPSSYPQIHGGEFVPNLATLDLLFNCGPESRRFIVG